MVPGRIKVRGLFSFLRCPLPLLVAALLTACAARPARAQAPILPAALTDFAAASDSVKDEALAVSLLVRSMLQPVQRQLVSVRELALGLGSLAEGRRRDLSLAPEKAKALGEKLLVDRVIVGAVAAREDHLLLTGQIFDGRGNELRKLSARAPRGAIALLAQEAARQIAREIASDFNVIAEASLREVRPFARAQAKLAAGDFAAAARALELAPPGVAKRLTAVRELGQLIWVQPQVSPEDRIMVALACGDAHAARTFADKLLKESPRSLAARAGRIRALVELGELKVAERELKQARAGASSPELTLAGAEFALAAGLPADERDAAFTLPTHEPAKTWLHLLSLVQALPPGALGPATEAALLSRAESLRSEQPALAAAIAYRALAAGIDPERAISLMEADDLGLHDIDRVTPALDKLTLGGNATARALKAELERRTQLALEFRLSAVGSASLAEHVGLVTELAPLVERLERLAKGGLSSVVLVPLEGSGQAFYSPFKVRPETLRVGLGVILAGPAYRIPIHAAPEDTPPVPEGALTRDGIVNLAKRMFADAILLYRIRASGTQAEITLVLADPRAQEKWTSTGLIPGRGTALFASNPVPWLVLVIVLVGALGVTGKKLLSGNLVIQIKEDADASDPILCVKVSRSAELPTLGNPMNFIERMRKVPARVGRTEATRVGARTQLSGLSRGKWFVHLYGTYKRAGVVVGVHGPSFSREVEIKAGRTATVHFHMEATHAPFVVTVTDNGAPVPEAAIWIDQDQTTVHRTGSDGRASFEVPRGKHLLSIEARGILVDRPFDVLQTKLHEVPIKLDWERRRDPAARAQAQPSAGPAAGARRNEEPSTPPAAAAILAGAPPAGPVSMPGGNPFSAAPATAVAAAVNPFTALKAPGGNPFSRPSPAGTQAITHGPTGPSDDLRIGSILAQPPPAPASTDRLGGLERYQRTEKLGAGAMGVVYRARDVVLDREVALKIMSPDIRDNPEIAEKFQLEAKALAALNHPNIVTVFDQGNAGGELYMVMELVEGPGALDDILVKRTKLPPGEAIDIIDQLCAAMAYAHKRRIIHRDIKPANMFLTHDGIVKVGDFGLARAVAAMKITKTVVQGTPLYMSPEQILGRDVDFRADLYSIGCTFFECLTGQPPFIEGEVLYHHMHTPPPKVTEFEPTLPKALDALIDRCLTKDKEKRIQSADEIRAALKTIRAALR